MSPKKENKQKEQEEQPEGVRFCSPGLTAKGRTLQEMLDHYCRVFRPNLANYLNCFKELSFPEVLEMAPGKVCPCCGKKHPHQKRLTDGAFANFIAALKKQSARIQAAKDFEELYAAVCEARVHGIGSVTLYDAALRIGASLGVLPQNFVYFHGGAVIPGGRRSGRRETAAFDVSFAEHKMQAYEIEEFLCCFHSLLEEQDIKVLKRRKS